MSKEIIKLSNLSKKYFGVSKDISVIKNINLKFQKITKDVGIFLCIEWIRNIDNVQQTFE